MRLLTDQDVWAVTVSLLRSVGHDVKTVADLKLEGADDSAVLAAATADTRVLVTRDKGFGALAFLQDEPTAGVILIRIAVDTANEVNRRLVRLLEERSTDELHTAFCVVEPGRYRLRRLK